MAHRKVNSAFTVIAVLVASWFFTNQSTIANGDCFSPNECTYSIHCPEGYLTKKKFMWLSDYGTSDTIDVTVDECTYAAGEHAEGLVFVNWNREPCWDFSAAWCEEGESGPPECTSACYCKEDPVFLTPEVCSRGIRAVVEVKGDGKAFRNFFPDGIQFNALDCNELNCKKEVWMGGSWQKYFTVSFAVYNQEGFSEDATFTILVEFYEKLWIDGEEECALRSLGGTRGTINVKVNRRIDFDPFSFEPDITAGSEIAWIDKLERDFSSGSGDPSWSHDHKTRFWDCSEEKCDTIDPADSWLCPDTTPEPEDWPPCPPAWERVKVPAREEDVYAYQTGLPKYMSENGWYYSYGVTDTYIGLNLGSFGTFYFDCNKPADNPGSCTKLLLGSIEYCEQGQGKGNGTILWSLSYQYSSPARLKYIYNGNDHQDPENSQKFYKYTWDANGTELDVEYYNTDIDEDNPLRQWHVEFDSEGRVVEYSAGCSSGCGGGSGEYERYEYFDEPEFEGLIKKKFNYNGDVVLWNEYAVYEYEFYESEGSVDVNNYSFEEPDVNDGDSLSCIPADWSAVVADTNVIVFDPNEQQWSNRYDSGESIPDGSQILTPDGNGIQQDLQAFIECDTMYAILEVDVGAYIDNGTSEATLKLVAFDWTSPNDTNDLIVIDVNETSPPAGQGTKLIEGQWVTEEGSFDSSDYPGLVGKQLRIVLTGDIVDIDNVRLTTIKYTVQSTKPLLVSQRADPNASGEPNVMFVQWDYDVDADTAVEYKWVNNDYARITKYQYADSTFSTVVAKTEFDLLNDDPNEPEGISYITYYDFNDTNYFARIRTTTYPSGNRKDIETYDGNGVDWLVQSYVHDVENDANANLEQYRYDASGTDGYLMENLIQHINARGGVTDYYYNDGLLETRYDPCTAAGRQVNWFDYDGARRMYREWHKDTDDNWVLTTYDYNDTTGFLDKIIADDDYTSPEHIGLKETTEYRYNDFGQVTREKGPDGTVRGKSYGLGGELISDFVLADTNDFNEPNDLALELISQTKYVYDANGHIQRIAKAKDEEVFDFNEPNDWILTEYEYDFLGRRIAVIEDANGLKLKTTYEYNNQGEVKKVALSNGKWTKTIRDGRGLVAYSIVGYGKGDAEATVATTDFYFDDNGNLIEQIAPNNIRTKYEYDNFDRLKKVTKGL